MVVRCIPSFPPRRGSSVQLKRDARGYKRDARNGTANGIDTVHGREDGREKGRHFVRGQRSLEFHTWINSPASGVRSSSSSFLLVLRLPLVPSSSALLSPPPLRGVPCYANSEIHPVQPLMNARASCDTTTLSPGFASQPPPTPPMAISYTVVHDNEHLADEVGDALSRGGDRSGCDIRAVIVLNLLRAVLFTLPRSCLPAASSIGLVI